MKTNAARLLDALGIRYEVRDYEPGDTHLSAEEVARLVGLEPGQVFKTLVVRGERAGVLFAVLPGDRELDSKALARLADDKRCDPVGLKEVQPLTGYVRGGVTALAAKKGYPTYVDETITSFARVSVSAGVRGTQIVLAPLDFVRAAKGRMGPISRAKEAR